MPRHDRSQMPARLPARCLSAFLAASDTLAGVTLPAAAQGPSELQELRRMQEQLMQRIEELERRQGADEAARAKSSRGWPRRRNAPWPRGASG